MTGTARAGEDNERSHALGERLKAWFGALSNRPVPGRLLDRVDELERREADTPSPGESPQA